MGKETLRKKASVSSFLEEKGNLEFHIKSLYCEEIELSLNGLSAKMILVSAVKLFSKIGISLQQ
jgi:hypothetical protein